MSSLIILEGRPGRLAAIGGRLEPMRVNRLQGYACLLSLCHRLVGLLEVVPLSVLTVPCEELPPGHGLCVGPPYIDFVRLLFVYILICRLNDFSNHTVVGRVVDFKYRHALHVCDISIPLMHRVNCDDVFVPVICSLTSGGGRCEADGKRVSSTIRGCIKCASEQRRCCGEVADELLSLVLGIDDPWEAGRRGHEAYRVDRPLRRRRSWLRRFRVAGRPLKGLAWHRRCGAFAVCPARASMPSRWRGATGVSIAA